MLHHGSIEAAKAAAPRLLGEAYGDCYFRSLIFDSLRDSLCKLVLRCQNRSTHLVSGVLVLGFMVSKLPSPPPHLTDEERGWWAAELISRKPPTAAATGRKVPLRCKVIFCRLLEQRARK